MLSITFYSKNSQYMDDLQLKNTSEPSFYKYDSKNRRVLVDLMRDCLILVYSIGENSRHLSSNFHLVGLTRSKLEFLDRM